MFSEKTIDFLETNRIENSREWFKANKSDYDKHVIAPLVKLDEYIEPIIREIDSQIVTEPKIDKAISRIYCDMRYSKGLLFRDSAWLSLKRDRHQFPCYPEFYVVFSPYMFIYGCGYYAASKDVMDEIRTEVIEDGEMFLKAKAALDSQSVLSLQGEKFKRLRYPNEPTDKQQWLNLKNICCQHTANDIRALFADNLPQTIANAFASVKDVYSFFIYAEEKTRNKRRFL